ncbi:MAG: class I SAM-dependent rRNA methyltransferase [Geminicoccaceae bacterium]
MPYPTVRIQPGRDKRLRSGSPWLYSNELSMDDTAKSLEPGSLVRIMAGEGRIMGVAHFNPKSLIAARMLTRNKDADIDAEFFRFRIRRALSLRTRIFDRPFYRLVHAEGDGLPGLVIDRYGDVLVVQFNSAGMERHAALLVELLEELLQPLAILARNDAPVRELEGLPSSRSVLAGEVPPASVIEENGLEFEITLGEGQKTGWYFDQRDNRAFVRRLATDMNVLDLYSYGGGFGLNALAGGARAALLVDRSEQALASARQSALRQGRADDIETLCGDVFHEAASLIDARRRFGVVIADPPPFVRSKKDLATGLKGYRKLARMSSALVEDGGFLAVGCCSHNVPASDFHDMVWAGMRAAGRGGRVIRFSGAGADHPVHPGLPETSYLKFLVMALD